MADDKKQPIIKKVKKVTGHSAHGGAWKIAYADLVTALMAFFLVMWIIGLDYKTRIGIAEYFGNPASFRLNQPSSETFLPMGGSPAPTRGTGKENNLDDDSAARLKSMIISNLQNDAAIAAIKDSVEVEVTQEGLRIEFHEVRGGTTYFEKGSSALRSEARKAIEAVALVVVAERKRKIVIEGHVSTDHGFRPAFGPWDLSANRANAIRQVMEQFAMPKGQLLAVKGIGTTQPILPDNPADQINNRVAVLIPYVVPTILAGETRSP